MIVQENHQQLSNLNKKLLGYTLKGVAFFCSLFVKISKCVVYIQGKVLL